MFKRNLKCIEIIIVIVPVEISNMRSRLAQLAERETVNLEASGSIPLVRAFCDLNVSFLVISYL
jgi:hypothetical protein